MNLHLLRHIPNAVRNSGPLWAQSLFGFECNNGVLAKSVNGNHRILEEMANKYILKREALQETEKQENDSNLRNFIGRERKKKLNDSEQSIFEEHGLLLIDKSVRVWESMKWRGTLFTSTNYAEV